jgi:N-acetylneuraminate synthase/N,N'-diacetyllegionaminate synthase
MTGEAPTSHLIWERTRCLIVAEAGVNHNGSVDRAHQLIALAADCGADAVKFQTFDPRMVVSANASLAPYQQNREGERTQQDMLRRLALRQSAWRELADHALQRGLVFLSTAFDEGSLELLIEVGVSALKVPSGELDNLPFIRRLAECHLPMIISTGLSTLDEVSAAVDAAATAPDIALLHCVTAYPAPREASNLLAIRTMRQRFHVPVGWSDHTTGSLTAIAAVAVGASILEKHITVNRNLPGPDHAASESADAFARYVADVRTTERAMGDGCKLPVSAEEENRRSVRRSFHATRELLPGETVGPTDVQLLRPADGLPPSTNVVGRVAARRVLANSPIGEADLL